MQSGTIDEGYDRIISAVVGQAFKQLHAKSLTERLDALAFFASPGAVMWLDAVNAPMDARSDPLKFAITYIQRRKGKKNVRRTYKPTDGTN